jgi:hypothetical protein
MKGKGADFRLYNRSFRVAARLEKSGIAYFDNALFIPMAGIDVMESGSRSAGAIPLDLVRERPSLLLLQLVPGADPRNMALAIEKSVTGVRVLTISELFGRERTRLAQMATAVRPMTMAGWLIAISAGGAVQLLYWRERRPVLGLLQAWGYGKRDLLLLFTLESLLLSLGGMVAGSTAAFLLLQLSVLRITRALGLPLLFGADSAAVTEIPGLCLLFSAGVAAVTLVTLLGQLRREPAELMRGV